MKRIVLIVNLLLAFAGFSFAQAPAATTAKKPKATKTATATPAASATPAAGPKKADGTPDMRYKANKDAAKTPPQHLKKDGTPDKRYKENKPAAKP
ncbi:MAG TPA: hypothetical protein VN824_08300 [Puia sp.]|nr:hypothetical protein [Puia sp.]